MAMRGGDFHQDGMFSYVSPDKRVPQDHPLRPIRKMVDQALREMSPLFDTMYFDTGRRSVAPEKLLRALLLQILYSVRSERLLIEQLDYNLLFRWFVGLSMDDAVWDHSTFSKNRDRLLGSEVAAVFFERVLAQAKAAKLLSDEHFTVDGTLIEAWASHKSFRPKDEDKNEGGKGTEDFHGEKRSNATHQSQTDPDARLFRKGKGKESKLSYMGHALIENRHSLVVGSKATKATGKAERDTAAELVEGISGNHRVTVGGDKGYDTEEFVEKLKEFNATPHVAQKKHSAIDGRTTRHKSYARSQHARKRIEKVFGWCKMVGALRKVKQRGVERVDQILTLTMTAYNLVRMRNLGLGTT
jgi:transposase